MSVKHGLFEPQTACVVQGFVDAGETVHDLVRDLDGFFGFDKVVERGYLFGKPGNLIPIIINEADVALEALFGFREGQFL